MENKKVPDRKTFYDKNNYIISDFKQRLEKQNWQKNKQISNAFLEQLANNIDNAITNEGKIILLGDYN